MIRSTPSPTRTYRLFPCATRVRSQGGEVVEGVADVVLAALEGSGDGVEELVHLGRVDGADDRSEPVEQLAEVDHRCGALDRAAVLEGLGGVARVQVDVALAEIGRAHV